MKRNLSNLFIEDKYEYSEFGEVDSNYDPTDQGFLPVAQDREFSAISNIQPIKRKRDQKKEEKEEVGGNLSSMIEPLMQHKRRGRKREHDQRFFQNAEEKISEVREILKTAKADGYNVKERAKMRNQISACVTRVRRRKELLYLNDVVRAKDQKFQALVQVVFDQLPEKDTEAIFSRMTQKWNIY